MKGQGVVGLLVGLSILGGCAAGLEVKPVQEEIRQEEELARQIGDQKAAETGRQLELEQRFNEAVREEAARGKASVTQGDDELNIYLSDDLIFSRENALQMTAEGEMTMERIGAILREVPDVSIDLEAATAFKPYGKSEEATVRLNQQLDLQLLKLAEYLEQKIGLRPERIRLPAEAAMGEKAKKEKKPHLRIVLIPTIK